MKCEAMAMAFQFTTSHGGRLYFAGSDGIDDTLSIHDLTRRSTISGKAKKSARGFQFTTSHGGRQHEPDAESHYICSFNSRPHTEVDPLNFFSMSVVSVFQFTTSHGGRQERRDRMKRSTDFQFTTSHGGRRNCASKQPNTKTFQFTTSHGGRRDTIAHNLMNIYLSIHDLTRRSTLIRSQANIRWKSFNSRPHTEVDFQDLQPYKFLYFFQFTTSHGGRLFDTDGFEEWRIFQFTTSHGGRPAAI